MSTRSRDKRTKEKILALMRAGRFGRACRVYARWRHTSPRLWKDPKRRQEWIDNPTW